jgi:phosphohistidine phosphatase SixA
LKPAEGLESFVPLSNAVPADELLKALQARIGKRPEALAVGHQPQLGELAAHLCGKVFELRPGGLIALEIGADKTQASWVRNPPPPKA